MCGGILVMAMLLFVTMALHESVTNKTARVADLPEGWEMVGPGALRVTSGIKLNDRAAEQLQALEPAGIVEFRTDSQGNLVYVGATNMEALLEIMRDHEFAKRLDDLDASIVRLGVGG